MGHCPFCKGAITAELLVQGGTCPHCLIEIPGEEAPTDPGEQAVARQQAEEAAASGRRGPLVAVAAVVLLAVVGGGAWAVLGNQQPEIVELDEETFPAISLDAHQNIYDLEVEDQEVARGSSGGGSSGGGSSAGSSSSSSATSHGTATGGQLAQGSAAASTTSRATLNPAAGSLAKQVEQVDPTASSASPGMMSGPSISVGSRNAAETLTDPQQIADMIKRVVGRNSRQLQDCYNDQLKVNESLEGRWRVSFEVQKNGSVAKVAVSGLSMADAELETCMVGKVSKWRFQPIKEAQGVSKNYSFTR